MAALTARVKAVFAVLAASEIMVSSLVVGFQEKQATVASHWVCGFRLIGTLT
jgi:hypothetical protein